MLLAYIATYTWRGSISSGKNYLGDLIQEKDAANSKLVEIAKVALKNNIFTFKEKNL